MIILLGSTGKLTNQGPATNNLYWSVRSPQKVHLQPLNSKPFGRRTWIRLILIAAGIVVLTYSVSPLLKHLLASRMQEKLVGNFRYEFKNLIVDLPTRSVTFDNVKWKFPKDSTIHSQEGNIKRLRFSGISILSVLWGLIIALRIFYLTAWI
ncbi:MAG: hypothetical protein U5K54_02710 [Cytophagales bacterium]|nr:hypothetical protein [Cytophagales bacterium]